MPNLTALSAQIGYIVHSKSMLQLKIEINEKFENVTCWEYCKMKPLQSTTLKRAFFVWGNPSTLKI